MQIHNNNNNNNTTVEHFLPWLEGVKFQACRPNQQELHCTTPDLHGIPTPGLDNLHFGILLDGITEYSDLGPVEVNEDPSFADMGSYDLQYPFETTITISVSRW